MRDICVLLRWSRSSTVFFVKDRDNCSCSPILFFKSRTSLIRRSLIRHIHTGILSSGNLTSTIFAANGQSAFSQMEDWQLPTFITTIILLRSVSTQKEATTVTFKLFYEHAAYEYICVGCVTHILWSRRSKMNPYNDATLVAPIYKGHNLAWSISSKVNTLMASS